MLILVVEIDKFMSKNYSTKRLVKLALVFAICNSFKFIFVPIFILINILFLIKFNFNLKVILKNFIKFSSIASLFLLLFNLPIAGRIPKALLLFCLQEMIRF